MGYKFKSMKIITINIRGLGNATKWRYINELNRKEEVGMICIQETKMKNINKEKCFKLWDDNNVEWLHKEVVEGAGGYSMYGIEMCLYVREI